MGNRYKPFLNPEILTIVGRIHVLIILTFCIGQLSCQNKPSKIVYENNSVDSPTELNSNKRYILKKKTINSDFDYSKLDNIDNHKKEISFEPINGEFTYYQFIATFEGEAYIAPGDSGNPNQTFHDILIIKTNENNEVVDAYQYTLEWAEPPFQYDVFKNSSEKVVLTDNLDIKLLKLTRTEYWNEKDTDFKESGVIRLR